MLGYRQRTTFRVVIAAIDGVTTASAAATTSRSAGDAAFSANEFIRLPSNHTVFDIFKFESQSNDNTPSV